MSNDLYKIRTSCVAWERFTLKLMRDLNSLGLSALPYAKTYSNLLRYNAGVVSRSYMMDEVCQTVEVTFLNEKFALAWRLKYD